MKKYRIAVITLLALLAASATGCLLTFIRGSLQDLTLRKHLRGQAAFQLQEKEFARLKEEHAAWKRLPDDLRAFRQDYIIGMDDFALFRRDLNSCLNDNGLMAANISLQFGKNRKGIRKVSIGFSLEAPYRNLKKFIFEMEKKPKMQYFEQINLSAGPDTVRGKFTMEAYLGE